MDKTAVLKAFNKILNEFLEEVIHIVPDSTDIKKTKVYFDTIRSFNPSLVIKLWYSNIYAPYANEIDNGDIRFFIEKEYTEDIHALQNNTEVLQGIQKIREPIKSMSESNKATSMDYIQKLSQLSTLYKQYNQ